MAFLVLVRHGQSYWNEKGLWTGLTDIDLTKKGEDEAKKAAKLIKEIHFGAVFTSNLARAQQTLDIIKTILNIKAKEQKNDALNERDYGDYTGKNKWEIQKEVGQEAFQKIRRSWDYPIPHGETLKDVYNRVVPFYQARIEPLLKDGKNVLICAHGNSIRALVKYLEHISDEEISNVELATGELFVYTIDETGRVVDKEIRGHRENLA